MKINHRKEESPALPNTYPLRVDPGRPFDPDPGSFIIAELALLFFSAWTIAYHLTMAAFIVAGLGPIVYILLYRELGLGRLISLAAGPAALAFLLLDGNRHLLAPEEVAWVLCLMNPTVRLEVSRPLITRHIFRNAGLAREGDRRAAAQRVVQSGEREPGDLMAFRQSIENGVDAIVLEKRRLPIISGLLDPIEGGWAMEGEQGGYLLFLKSRVPLPGEFTTLAELLRERGYRTAAAVGNYVLKRKYSGGAIHSRYRPARSPTTGIHSSSSLC
ncbi:MAG: hypothetical protein V1789_09195 [PVC group bacterium]